MITALWSCWLVVGDDSVVPESDAEPSPVSVGNLSRVSMAVTETMCYGDESSAQFDTTTPEGRRAGPAAETQVYLPDSDAETGYCNCKIMQNYVFACRIVFRYICVCSAPIRSESCCRSCDQFINCCVSIRSIHTISKRDALFQMMKLKVR